MDRYRPLLAIVVSHEDPVGMAMHLRFIPSLDTTALMLRERLLLRHTPDGAELWRGAAYQDAVTLPLVFQVVTRNVQLQSCTQWPVARPLRYVGVAGQQQLRPETLAAPGASQRPLLSLEIDFRPAPDGACTTYRIALAANRRG